MADILDQLQGIVGHSNVRAGDEILPEYTHDEALTAQGVQPLAVAFPASTAEVAALLRLCAEFGVPVVARGTGTGLSGGCLPNPDGVVVAFDRMNQVLDLDTSNHVVVVQPGVTLAQLDQALQPHGLLYPVSPGENSASLGGNVATNAGGMRAVRYGVTRHHVLGLEAVLPGGEVIRCGGRFAKSSTGYDLTQLIIGSEGTLALVTEVTLKVQPRPRHSATVLAPFVALPDIAAAVAPVVASGLGPVILEYLDAVTMSGITTSAGVELGISPEIQSHAQAYLIVVLDSDHADRLDEDVEHLGELLEKLGALEVFVLPPQAGIDLIRARERAFFVAKAAGANDIVDTVVPRAAIPEFLQSVSSMAQDHGAFVIGCGHVGDGNVHLSVFQPDAQQRSALLADIFATAGALGGAISGEHGIGTEKRRYFLELEDPAKLALMRRIKSAFDPQGILSPGHVLDYQLTPQVHLDIEPSGKEPPA